MLAGQVVATHQRINKQQQPVIGPVIGPRVGPEVEPVEMQSLGRLPTDSVSAPRNLGPALQRAETFGHCLTGVAPQAPMQRVVQPIRVWHLQRQLVEEEQKRDEDAESAQRKAIQRSARSSNHPAPPVQFFVGKLVAKMAGKFLNRHFPGRR